MGSGTSFGLPTSGSGSTDGGDFLGDTLKFETFHGGNILKQIAKDPSRLLTGVDPASTGLWNSILGTNNKPIVDQLGGATKADYNAASNAGINTTAGHDTEDLAHVIAAAFGAQGLAGAGGSDTGLAGDDIDAGGGWNPASGSDPALDGDDIDAGGGWNPSTGGSGSSSGLSTAQRNAISNALKGLGKQQPQRPTTFAMQQAQRLLPMSGVGFISPTSPASG